MLYSLICCLYSYSINWMNLKALMLYLMKDHGYLDNYHCPLHATCLLLWISSSSTSSSKLLFSAPPLLTSANSDRRGGFNNNMLQVCSSCFCQCVLHAFVLFSEVLQGQDIAHKSWEISKTVNSQFSQGVLFYFWGSLQWKSSQLKDQNVEFSTTLHPVVKRACVY